METTEGRQKQATRRKPVRELGGQGRTKKQEAVLTCSHWVRYCHSDKSHYGSPFQLTCGGGRNRAVSLKTKEKSRQLLSKPETDGWLSASGASIGPRTFQVLVGTVIRPLTVFFLLSPPTPHLENHLLHLYTTTALDLLVFIWK